MGSQGTFPRGHLRTYQKAFIGVIVLGLVLVFSTTNPFKSHRYLRFPGSEEEKADDYTPSFIHAVELPPQVPSRVESQAPLVAFEKDKDDVNPMMRAGVRKALVISSYKDQDLTWLDDLAEVSPG